MNVMLGGIPIRLQAGAPVQQYAPLGGSTILRRSGGAAVKMTRWRKTAITISGSGWMGPGFAGLDTSQPLELRCTAPQSLHTTALTGTLPSAPRPDVAPWALAYVAGEWVPAAVAMAGAAFTLTAVPGAAEYHVRWMPMFTVFVDLPTEGMDSASATYDWSFTAEEA